MQVVGAPTAAACRHANLDSHRSVVVLANLHVHGMAPQVHACYDGSRTPQVSCDDRVGRPFCSNCAIAAFKTCLVFLD